ncbi:Lrp/AsnC family transcriptional regulator [Variovorax sp. PCZ-1]|uniref:Lrp/AsnC family transcriptional regulator n=1 Tax=Variovorax sp. PCZ-1 TaxID=2835533 RepID=UPI001BCAB91B|nr:Lrp/AsnC family transcriptional regulator [Variovorax sp. PCZ-1]MBS7807067.1 Lrp/AsnC family transcriptional regulator [Variovorax sp. PCZ-1]
MLSTENSEIDSYDTRILAELQRDARISMSELGRRVHLSQPAVAERVKKLEISGVITGYHAAVNPARLGYGIRALVRVGRADYATVLRRVEQSPEVINAFNVTGEDSWTLEIAVQDVSHLDEVVTKFCLLTETSTSIILNAPRENHALQPVRLVRSAQGNPAKNLSKKRPVAGVKSARSAIKK